MSTLAYPMARIERVPRAVANLDGGKGGMETDFGEEIYRRSGRKGADCGISGRRTDEAERGLRSMCGVGGEESVPKIRKGT
jgi:hypothetical protein